MSNLTRKAIRDSLMRLLDDRPLSRIKVKDIVDDCGINRNTFYYHYPDLPALLEEILREECDRIVCNYPHLDSLEQCIDMALDFMLSNRRAALHIYNSVNRDAFEHYLWKLCEYAVGSYMDGILKHRTVSPSDRDIMVNFLSCECFGLVMWWMREGMSSDLKEDFRRLTELRGGSIEEMIERSTIS